MARTYTEQEIAALLARAAERQRATPDTDAGPTLTLGEIERLAAEAGLDPAHVRAAAAEMSGPAANSEKPSDVTFERWLDLPFSDIGWEDAVTELRARYGTNMAAYTAVGTTAAGADVSRVGAAHQWTHASMSGATTTVTASPRGDRTRVRLSYRTSAHLSTDIATAGLYGLLASILPAFVVFVAGVRADAGGLTIVLSVLVAVAAVTSLAAVLGAPAARRSRERQARRAAETMDLVVRRLEEAALDPNGLGTRSSASLRETPAGRVDFDAAVGDADGTPREPEPERRREVS